MLTVKFGPFQPALEDAFIADLEALKAREVLAPVAVVTPSRCLADRLQRLCALERGRALLNVRFHTFNSLAEEIVAGAASGRTVSDPFFHDRLVDGLLRASGVAGAEFPIGLSGAYRSTLRDLLDAGITGEAREVLRGHFLPAAAEDWRRLEALFDLQERYQSRLAAAGVAHGSERVRLAARRVQEGRSGLERYAAILYYGFYDLTGVQADFFRAVSGSQAAVTLYYPFRRGHPAFTFAERFFDVQLGAARREALAPGTDRRALGGALDALFDETRAPVAVPQDRLRLVSASGARDECWAVAKAIVSLRAGPERAPFSEIGVVARSLEPYRTVLPEVFRENAIPFSMPEGEPLLRHPVAKLALTLLSLRRREFPAGAVLDIAQSPYFRIEAHGGVGRGAELAGAWGRLLRRTGLHSGWLQWQSKVAPWSGKDFGTLGELADEDLGAPIAAADTAALWRWVSGLERDLRGRGDDWAGMAAHALALLDAAFVVPAGDPGTEAWAAAREAVRGLGEFDLAFPPPRWEDFLDAAEERLRRAVLEPGPPGGGVRVSGVMDARGDSFRHLFLIGLAEGSFPRPVEEDPLLGDAARERLQHPGGYWILPKRSGLGGLDGYGEEKLLFHLMATAAAESLTCVFPRSDDDGRPRVPSFYLRALCRAAGRAPEDASVRRVERRPFAKLEALAAQDPALLSPKEVALLSVRDGSDPAPFLEAAGRSPGLLSACLGRLPALNAPGEPGALDGLAGVPSRPAAFSPSALEAFAACPFKYFGSRVLRLEPPEAPVERGELAPWFKGKIYHDALRRFHQAGGVAASRGEPGPGWERLLRRAFEESLAGLDWKQAGLYPLLWEAQKARMAARLTAFVAWDLSARQADGYRPRAFEAALRGVVEGIALSGRADRLDEGPDGVRVVDYKSRGSERLRDGVRRMRRLQAPVYLALVEASGDPAAGACFYGIEDAFLEARDPAQVFSKADWTAARGRFLSNLAGLVRWIEQGRFPITPEEERFGACWHCPFDRMCRKAHPATRRRAAASALRRELEALRTLPLPDARRRA